MSSSVSVIPVQGDTSPHKNTVAQGKADPNGNGVERCSLCSCAQSGGLIVMLVVVLHSSLTQETQLVLREEMCSQLVLCVFKMHCTDLYGKYYGEPSKERTCQAGNEGQDNVERGRGAGLFVLRELCSLEKKSQNKFYSHPVF